VKRAATGALALALALLAADAAAHGRSLSTSRWQIDLATDAGAQVQVRVAWSDLQRAVPGLESATPLAASVRPDLAERIEGFLLEHFRLATDAGDCVAEGPVRGAPAADPAHLERRWTLLCPGTLGATLAIDAFADSVPGHFHLARVRVGEGPVREQVFTGERRRATLEGEPGTGAAAPGASFADFLELGVRHIASGADHLLFLLALLLVGVSLRELVTIVTGFTLAHSVTLALGVLGVVRPEAGAIEALIGLSIAVVALENFAETTRHGTRRLVVAGTGLLFAGAVAGALAGAVAVPAGALAGVGVFSLCYLGLLRRVDRPGRLRWFVAFVFGLVHGFGFAGLMAQVGLPPGRTAPALLGFNLGVEVGQLAVVAAAWPLLRALSGRDRRHAPLLVHAGSACVLAAGLYWFLARALGASSLPFGP